MQLARKKRAGSNRDAPEAQKCRKKNKNYSKRKLCKLISRHYIKQLNLIASIISAVNPTNNFCRMRLKKLFHLMIFGIT